MGMKDKQLAKEIAERRMIMIAPLIGALLSVEEYYRKPEGMNRSMPSQLRLGLMLRRSRSVSESTVSVLTPQGFWMQ